MLHALAAISAVALVGYLLVMGLLGRQRFERFVEQLSRQPELRAAYYRKGIARQWMTVAVIGVIGLLAGKTPGDILLRRPIGDVNVSAAGGAGMVLGLLLGLVLVGRLRRTARGTRRLEVLMGRVHQLLPTNRVERLWFVPLALTAGVCEEIMFRGFLIAVVWWLHPSATDTQAAVATAVVFGLAHLYQGGRGVVLTGLVGYLLASLALSQHSLLLPMILHTLIDIRWALLPDTGADEGSLRPG
jgi:membrane protease YdiL (CAAX protease family)